MTKVIIGALSAILLAFLILGAAGWLSDSKPKPKLHKTLIGCSDGGFVYKDIECRQPENMRGTIKSELEH
jgi:hypothetical protein